MSERMNASDPQLEPTDEHPKKERRDSRPDPWGVKRAENLLTSLQGVLSARVEVSPIGEVTAVHILSQAGTAPKQMVRNIESALLAQLGLKVDHRKISVAQTANVKPIEALEQAAVESQANKRQIVFLGIDVEPVGSLRVKMRVTLQVRGESGEAEDEVADTKNSRMQGAARACVALLDRSLPESTMELEGLRMLEQFERQLVVCGVRTVAGRDTKLLSGSAVVTESLEQAAVLAVLDATNRWLSTRT
ncbi:MAG: hypothetical protein V3T56_09075 [Gemmatimonadales bacterium]